MDMVLVPGGDDQNIRSLFPEEDFLISKQILFFQWHHLADFHQLLGIAVANADNSKLSRLLGHHILGINSTPVAASKNCHSECLIHIHSPCLHLISLY